VLRGGIADKAGNRYEAKWVVRSILALIQGADDSSFLYESIDPADEKFEFTISRPTRDEHHQAKRKGTGNWTLRALEREGLLAGFAGKLSKSPTALCVFVSTDPAKDLADLCEKARTAQSCEQFESHAGGGAITNFDQLKTIWGQRADTCFNWLRRIQVRQLDERSIEEEIGLRSDYLFENGCGDVVGTIWSYLLERLNQTLTTETLREDVAARLGCRIKDWALDQTLGQRIGGATDFYLTTYLPHGVIGREIPRKEACEIADLLENDDSIDVILLTGVAGAGKSAVVRQTIKTLRDHDVAVLAWRVDRHLEAGGPATTAELGYALTGRNESPVITLRGWRSHQRSVLVIDQVDAVSDVSGRAPRLKDIVLQLVSEANRIGQVCVVLVCRDFDFSNDDRLKILDHGHHVKRVGVPLLDFESDVLPVLAELGLSGSSLTAGQKDLLRLPLNLALFVAVRPDGLAPVFYSTSDLLDRLVDDKQRRLPHPKPYWSMWNALALVANAMSQDQTLVTAESCLQDLPGAADILASEHLIVREDGRLAFFHEILFDRAYARDFVQRGASVVEFLLSAPQTLFRRTQVRQILSAYRAGRPQRYIQELRTLLASPDVRFHIKDAVARWLGDSNDPTNDEIDLVLSFDTGYGPLAPITGRATASTGWFDVLLQRGVLVQWLASADIHRRGQAAWRLQRATPERPVEVAGIYRQWWTDDPARADELLNYLSFFHDDRAPAELVDLLIEIVRSAPTKLFGNSKTDTGDFFILKTKSNRAASARVLQACFETWFERNPVGHPFDRTTISENNLYWIGELAKADSALFLEVAVSAFNTTLTRVAADPDSAGSRWNHPWATRYKGRPFGPERFLGLMRDALRTLARTDPVGVAKILDRLEPAAHDVALHLHLETISAGGEALADRLPPLLKYDYLFDAGWHTAEWNSFADAARSALRHLDMGARRLVEERILSHWPEHIQAIENARRDDTAATVIPARSREYIIHKLNSAGTEQWAVLATIGRENLSERAQLRLDQLDRKFRDRKIPQPHVMEVRWVPPPIQEEKARRMSDDEWLGAIRKYHGAADWGLKHGGASSMAQVLETQAKDSPARFASLLPRFPCDVDSHYPAAILRGVSQSELPEESALSAALLWAHGQPNRPFGLEIAQIFERQPRIARDNALLRILLWYVEHGESILDSDNDDEVIEREGAKLEDLLMQGGRMVVLAARKPKGASIEALRNVLWEVPEQASIVLPVVERLVYLETKLSMRAALLHAIQPLLKHGPDSAARLTEALVARVPDDLRPMTVQIGINVLFYLFRSAPERSRRILDAMLASHHESVRLVGALHLIRESFYDGELAVRAEQLLATRELAYRRLSAYIAAHHLGSAEYQDRAALALAQAFEDEEKEVRTDAGQCFMHVKPEEFRRISDLARSYVNSSAYEDSQFALFHALEEATADVTEIVIAAAERTVSLSQNDPGRQHGGYHHDLHSLMPLLKNAYEGSESDPTLRERILDVIDAMLQNALYGIDDVVKAHERA
jgi:hypothetical protein